MDTKRVKYFSTEFRGDLSSEERGKGWVLGSQKESFWMEIAGKLCVGSLLKLFEGIEKQ